ncbi:MAG: radical SAM protein [Lachnospiraceae bacterium]|nr:radical SAM protein [Lachnospiraceae bacterium]
MNKLKVEVLLIKVKEHKIKYVENVEDVRLGYVDALLKKNRIDTYIMDLAFCQHDPLEDKEKIREFIVGNSPKIVIFFIDKHPTNGPANTIELLDNLFAEGIFEGVRVAVYGNTHVDMESFFEHKVDSVILGEEDSALSYVKCVLNDGEYEDVEGIAYLNAEMNVCVNSASLRESLDELPFPTRYALNSTTINNYCASILSSRGCFGRCTYCYLRSKEKYFNRYPLRLRSVKNVVDEIESLYKLGVTEFYFSDDEFLQINSNAISRVVDFVEELKYRDLSINYSIYARADCINEEIVQILAESGLYCVFLGVESFSQNVLDRYNKGTLVETNVNAIRILQNNNVRVRLGMIMFDTMTTPEELYETILTLKKVMDYKPELIFQSMFFSNALIPLSDTPALSLLKNVKEDDMIFNNSIQANYEKRSRSGVFKYSFMDGRISDIYTCTEKMAERLLTNCIKDENELFLHGYSEKCATRLTHITLFAIELLESIFISIMDGICVEECNKKIALSIDEYYAR